MTDKPYSEMTDEPTKKQLNELADAYASTAKLHQDNSVASAVAYALRLAANLPSEEEIAISICQSGQFETGQGTCALICMNQLGAPRNKGCCHTKTVHKRLAARILERIRSVK